MLAAAPAARKPIRYDEESMMKPRRAAPTMMPKSHAADTVPMARPRSGYGARSTTRASRVGYITDALLAKSTALMRSEM